MGAEGLIVLRVAGLCGELAVFAITGFVQGHGPRAVAVNRAQHELVFGVAILQVTTAFTGHGFKAVGVFVDLLNGGFSTGVTRAQCQRTVLLQIKIVLADDVDAAGAGIDRVGHELRPGVLAVARLRQNALGVWPGNTAAEQQSITDGDLIRIDGHRGLVNRTQHQTQRVVGRLLRLQLFGTQGACRRVIGRQDACQYRVAIGIDVGGGGPGGADLAQCRCAISVVDGGT